MNHVILPPELEQFVAEAIASGRFRDTHEVIRTGVELLKRQEKARAELLASVLAAKQEAERVGYLSLDEVATHVRQTIARRSGVAS